MPSSGRIHVAPDGDDARDGKTWPAAKRTLPAAVAAMGADPGVIVLAAGDIDAGSGVTWTRRSRCGVIGQGPRNTRLIATGQTGPVLDLTAVAYGLDDAEFGGFTILGDGTAGTDKQGIAFSADISTGRAQVHDVTVRDTGGVCFNLGASVCGNFDRLVAYEPVDAASRDVPYLAARGSFNGNLISRLQLYGRSHGANVGRSGAVVITDDGHYAPHDDRIDATVTERLHLSADATVIHMAGFANVLDGIQPFDSAKVPGVTGTSHVRLVAPSVADYGGNEVRGVIPGRGTSPVSIDCGIDVRQSRNAIRGVKGYKGTNVLLTRGVVGTDVTLAGSVSSATDPAVVVVDR